LESQFLTNGLYLYELGQENSAAREQIVRGLEDVRRCTTEINAWLGSSKPDLRSHVSTHGKTLFTHRIPAYLYTLTHIWYGDGLAGVIDEKKVDEPGTLEPSSPSVCVCIFI
jgi:hypothetical protein